MLHMSDTRKTETSYHAMSEDCSQELFEIVNDTAQLSRELRLCGNVIYHWSSTFKDGMRARPDFQAIFTDVVYRGV
jgi:hypothetical protein